MFIENNEENIQIYEDTKGNIFYINEEGEFHRLDGPAKQYKSGQKEWYKNGKLHRENGPAVEFENDKKAYYLNGKYFYKEDYWTVTKQYENI